MGQPLEKLQEDRRDYPYITSALRKISPYFTKFSIEHGISANQVSLFTILFGIAGSILFLFGDPFLMLLSSLLYLFGNLLDHVDGEIARMTNTKTIAGAFLEEISWQIAEFTFFIFFGFGLYNLSGNILFVICGFSFALSTWIVRSLRQSMELMLVDEMNEKLRSPLIKRKTFAGRLYRKYYQVRMFFAVFRIGFLCVPLLEILLPIKPSYIVLGMQISITSTYFFIYGLDSIARVAYTSVKTYRNLKVQSA